VYVALGGHPGMWEPATMFVPLAAATTTFFLLNSGLIAAAIGLSTVQSPVRIWSDSFLWIWPSYLLGATVAVAIFSGVREGSLWLVAFLLVPLALTVRNLQVYFERFHQSQTDPLTGLPNQRFVLEHAARELARARRRGTSVAFALVDVDGFKSINDTHGHRAGDGALKRVARCLQQAVRPFDVCARFGGDEFLLVLPDCGAEAAVRRRESLQDAVNAMRLRLRGTDVGLTISVGIAVSPDDGESLERLLDLADARMYKGKARGRPRLVS
jgi:diguanylate cyclase (GGDEF)-like protein